MRKALRILGVVLGVALFLAALGGVCWATYALWGELGEIVKQVEGFNPSLAKRIFLLGLLAVVTPFLGAGTLMWMWDESLSPEALRREADTREWVRERRRRERRDSLMRSSRHEPLTRARR